MNKYCKACDMWKPVAEFGKNKARKDGLQSQCTSCRKTSNAKYYQKTPERNPQRRARVIQMRAEARAYIRAHLETHACVDCGFSDIRALDFDHVYGEKSGNISDMVRKGMSLDTIILEMEKCEVRCANCHRIVTHERRVCLRS